MGRGLHGEPGGAAALLPLTARPLGRPPNDAKDSSRPGHLARMIARAEAQGASTSWQHSAECLRRAGNVSTCLAQDTHLQNTPRSSPGGARTEVPRAFRTVHPLGWAIWKGDFLAPTEEELLAGIQG